MYYTLLIYVWNMISKLFLCIASKLTIYTINLYKYHLSPEIILVHMGSLSGHVIILAATSQPTYNTKYITIWMMSHFRIILFHWTFLHRCTYTTSLTHCCHQTDQSVSCFSKIHLPRSTLKSHLYYFLCINL